MMGQVLEGESKLLRLSFKTVTRPFYALAADACPVSFRAKFASGSLCFSSHRISEGRLEDERKSSLATLFTLISIQLENGTKFVI